MTRPHPLAIVLGIVLGVGGAIGWHVLSDAMRPPSAAEPVGAGPNEIAGISAAQARDASAAIAYIKAHPVPSRPGMTAGIITSVTELGDQCKPQATHTAAFMRGQDPCAAWAFTIITAAGGTLTVTCGSIGHPCPPLVPQNVMPGEEGEYLYVPSGGRIAPSHPVAFLECTSPGAYPCPAGAAVVP